MYMVFCTCLVLASYGAASLKNTEMYMVGELQLA